MPWEEVLPDSETLFSICAWGHTGSPHRSRWWLWPGTWDGPAPNCIYSNRVWSCFIAAGLRSVLQGWVVPEWIFSDSLLSSDPEMPSVQGKKKAFWYLKMSLNHRLQEIWLLVFWPHPLMKLVGPHVVARSHIWIWSGCVCCEDKVRWKQCNVLML